MFMVEGVLYIIGVLCLCWNAIWIRKVVNSAVSRNYICLSPTLVPGLRIVVSSVLAKLFSGDSSSPNDL